MRWWSADPQTPVLKPSDPIPDPSPTSSEPPASMREIADKPMQIASQEETVEQTLSQYLPIFADAQKQSADASDSSNETRRAHIHDAEKTFDKLYPETMSCREAFDTAMHCRGPGGQFINLYRYGEFRQCSEQWSQFWFCMRTRTKPDAVKRELIQDFYRHKEAAKYADSPNSEDIWEQRTQRLERAFDADLSKIDELPLEDTRLRRTQ
jgi:hypothetical protein